jgi:putative peptide zinc metalloprotease protein
MTDSVFRPLWLRVAPLKPSLRPHVCIRQHLYRKQPWYVLEDTATGRHYRYSTVAYYVLGLMDGSRTVQEIWEAAMVHLGEGAPAQAELTQLLIQLYRDDLLRCDVPPEAIELFQQHKRPRPTSTRWLLSPLAIRLAQWDPQPFLDRWLFLVRPIFGRAGAFLWLACVVAAAMLAAQHWSELTHNLVDQVLALHNLLWLFIFYVIPFLVRNDTFPSI